MKVNNTVFQVRNREEKSVTFCYNRRALIYCGYMSCMNIRKKEFILSCLSQ